MRISGGRGLKALLLAGATILPIAAQAQEMGQSDSPAQGGENDGAVAGDIVVTARRKDESLSKVPLSVAALSSESLASQGIRNENDLQIAVPGLQTVNGGNGYLLNFSIRGQTIDAYSGSPSAVLTYVNELQFTAPGPSAFFDLENVQVLKGPQGTLFGRNTTGGAVLYKTAAPGDELSGFVSARYGSFEAVQIQGAITVPLAGEAASLRIAGNHSSGGAWMRNHGYYQTTAFGNPGPSPSAATFVPLNRKYGNLENDSIRGTLLLKPFDGLTTTTMVQYGRDSGTFVPSLIAALSDTPGAQTPFDFSVLTGGPFTGAAGGLTANAAWQRQHNRDTYTEIDPLFHGRTLLVMNTTEIELSPELTLKNIVGWSKAERNAIVDYDGSAFQMYSNQTFFSGTPAGRNGQHNSDTQFSEELQLQGQLMDGRIDFTLGGFYSNLRHLEDNHLQFYNFPIPPYRFASRARSYAAFFQADYKLTGDLTFTGGIRYSKDDIDGHQLPLGAFTGVPGFEQDQKVSFSDPSWTVGFDYQVTPSLMVYVTQRGSFRSGGFNFPAVPRNFDGTGLVTASNPGGLTGNLFGAEKARDIELGAKFNGNLGGVPVTGAVAFYNQWIKHVQRVYFAAIPGVGPGLVTTNVPEAQITGQEFNFSARPSGWLEIGAQLSHTNARFTKPIVFAVGRQVPFGPFAFAPEWAGSAYVNLKADLGLTGELSWRTDVYGQTKSYYSNYRETTCVPGVCQNSAGDGQIPGYALVNTRLSWTDILGSRVELAVYGKNLFDRMWYQGGNGTSRSFGIDLLSPGRPREFGVEAKVSF